MNKESSRQSKQQLCFKIIIIGDSGVGKTNILVRYCTNQFKHNYVATIGVDFKIKTIQIDNYKIKFQIWDTAGQQRYRTITQTYYKGAAGIILVYSIDDDSSFQSIQSWMQQINQHSEEDIKIILVGNKCDKQQQERKVHIMQGKVLSHRYKINFLEVSAKTGQNINQIFDILAKEIIEDYIINEKQQQIKKINSITQSVSKKNCEC